MLIDRKSPIPYQSAEVEPGLWQPHLKTAIPGMLALAGPGQGVSLLPDDLRRSAAEFVMTLVDLKPEIVQVGDKTVDGDT